MRAHGWWLVRQCHALFFYPLHHQLMMFVANPLSFFRRFRSAYLVAIFIALLLGHQLATVNLHLLLCLLSVLVCRQ